MRIYVAGRTKNVIEVNIIQDAVLEHGHEITHDWTDIEGKGEIRSDWSGDPERARQVATLDFLGVTKADGVILCGYGCDEESKGGLGCFIEVGIALASGIPVVILGPVRESVFWYSPFTFKIFKDDPLGEEETQDSRIKLEAGVAINGLESLNRQKRLALDSSDATVKI